MKMQFFLTTYKFSLDVAISEAIAASSLTKPASKLLLALHRLHLGLRSAISCLVPSSDMLAAPPEDEGHQTKDRGQRHLAKECTSRCNIGVSYYQLLSFFPFA